VNQSEEGEAEDEVEEEVQSNEAPVGNGGWGYDSGYGDGVGPFVQAASYRR
jgi:hypothetical protein